MLRHHWSRQLSRTREVRWKAEMESWGTLVLLFLQAGPDVNGAGTVVTHGSGWLSHTFHLEISHYRPFHPEIRSPENPSAASLEGTVPPVGESTCLVLPGLRHEKEEDGVRRDHLGTAFRAALGQSHFPANMMTEKIFSIGYSRLYVPSEHIPTARSCRPTMNKKQKTAWPAVEGGGNICRSNFFCRLNFFLNLF